MQRYAPQLVIFLVGLAIMPLMVSMFYEVSWVENSAILLTPKVAHESVDVTFEKATPEGDPKICSRHRWLIKKAVMDYNSKGKMMKQLELFSLIGAGNLREMPNCPDGGSFAIQYQEKKPVVACSIHGVSSAK